MFAITSLVSFLRECKMMEYETRLIYVALNNPEMPQFDKNGQYCGHSKPQIPEDELDELIHRTPGYWAWQQEEWLVHCNSPCAFIGYVGWNEIKDQLDRFIDLEKDCQRFNEKWGITELSENLFNGSSCQGYLFECIHCHG